jgi:Doubled CXXCH motif (Paired_CXXCH_1)
MTSFKTRLVVLAVCSLGPAVVWGQFLPGTGMLGTPHDFASAGGNGIVSNEPTGVGLCTYCHTPHKAISTQLLWNHTLSASTFSWDVAKTTAGTTLPSFVGTTYKGPTAKCLSCHDGTVAVGDVAWYKETARTAGNELTTLKMGDIDPIFVIAAGSIPGNLAGNHPVAHPYPAGGTGSTYNGSTTGSAAVLSEWQPNPTLLGAARIRLFNDDGTGAITAGVVSGKTGIECSSCHDPHNKATVDDFFLRGKAQGSTQADGYLCLQCHIK